MELSFLSDFRLGGRYSCSRIVGRGSSGEVAEGVAKATGTRVAVKKMLSAPSQTLLREIVILRHLRHPNIVKLVDTYCPACTSSADDAEPTQKKHRVVSPGAAVDLLLQKLSEVYLVFEWLDTDLYAVSQSAQYLGTEHIAFITSQILAGLEHLHLHNICHRDLKPANILMNHANCRIKIADFGLARSITTTEESPGGPSSSSSSSTSTTSQSPLHGRKLSRRMTIHVVTRWYRAPELLLQERYNCAVDLWSAGCILAELLGMQRESVPLLADRRPLFPGRTSCLSPLLSPAPGESTEVERLDQLQAIFNVIGTPSDDDVAPSTRGLLQSQPKSAPKNLHILFPGAEPAALDLLQKLLAFSPRRRLDATQALRHPYLEAFPPNNRKASTSAQTQANAARLGLELSQRLALDGPPVIDELWKQFDDSQLAGDQGWPALCSGDEDEDTGTDSDTDTVVDEKEEEEEGDDEEEREGNVPPR